MSEKSSNSGFTTSEETEEGTMTVVVTTEGVTSYPSYLDLTEDDLLD